MGVAPPAAAASSANIDNAAGIGDGNPPAAARKHAAAAAEEHGHVAIATVTPEGHPRADGWNLRDIATVDPNRIRSGLVFRSSQVFNKEAVARLQIRSAVDLRKADRRQRKAARHGEEPANPLTNPAKEAKAVADKLVAELPLGGEAHEGFEMAVGSDTLQDYGLQVYHAELLPKRAQLKIFRSVPRRYKWRTIKAALTCHNPQAVMAPVVADPQTFGLAKLYCLMLDMAKPYIKRALEVFADANNLPCVVHCVHGKDRTGLLAALLLLLLGVDEAAVVEDYVVSEHKLKEGRASVEEKGEIESHMVADIVIASPAEVMQATLRHLRDKYGGIHGYLKAPGLAASLRARVMLQAVTLTRAKIGDIRRNLLTPEAFAAIDAMPKKSGGVRQLAKRLSDLGRPGAGTDVTTAASEATHASGTDAAATAAGTSASGDSGSTDGSSNRKVAAAGGSNSLGPAISAIRCQAAGTADSCGSTAETPDGSGPSVAAGSSLATAGPRCSLSSRE